MDELKVDTSELGRTWEGIIPSSNWEPIGEYHLAQQLNLDITQSIDDNNPWYVEDLPFGGPIANSAVLLNMAAVAVTKMCGVYPRSRRPMVLAKLHYEWVNPVKVGGKIRFEGRIPDKYVKRDKKYLILEARLFDEDNVLLAIYRQTRMVGG